MNPSPCSSGSEAGAWLKLFAVHQIARQSRFEIFIFFGLTMSVYLPFVPVIIWIGAIATWLIVVIEAVVAAPLWAATHLDTDGEGMGVKTQHGYLFMLNVLFRPTFMLFGFILASILVEVIGGFWTWAFSYAMASVQGDSYTGLFAVIGFFTVYVLTCLSIVNTCFAAIHVVPDNALGWLGGQMSNNFGRGTEDYVNSKTGGAITAMGSRGQPGAGAREIKENKQNIRRFGGKGGETGGSDIQGEARNKR